jgi:hypothetical protein
LEVGQVGVNLLPKGKARELSAQGLLEPLHAPVGLRTLPCGAGMIEIFHRPLQLSLGGGGTAAVCRAPIRQAPAQRDCVRLKDGHPLLSEQIRRRQRGRAGVELSKGHFAVGIDKRLLGDTPYTL